MSYRQWGYREFASWAMPHIPKFHLQDDQSGYQSAPEGCAKPAFALTLRRHVCFCYIALIVLVAVIGEIAALAAASVLHLGAAGTGLALACVVLSAIWPLARTAP